MAYTNIDDPSAYFQALVYAGTGNSASQPTTHTNDGNSDLQPDLIWFKDRGATYSHYLVDSSRGRAKGLKSDTTAAETTSGSTAWDLVSFDTDGFKVGFPSEGNSTNGGTTSKVAWQWKVNGGTTSTNTDGDINSTVQVNSDAGFSIVQYVPTNTTARSIGHGLGVQPQVVIVRNRPRVENWRVFHRSAGTTGSLKLDDAAAYNSSTTLFTGDSTSTVFKVGTDFSVNGNYPYVAYCFAEKQGYSKFGKYVGNGNANGTFVYTGFKPAWVMIKRTDSADSWAIFDNKRSDSGGFNVIDKHLRPDSNTSELDPGGVPAAQIDILSNGFKQRESNGQLNASGGSYIYMAFAENPFTTSTGIPTTAR